MSSCLLDYYPIIVVGKEISVSVNNAMVLSNDLTLTGTKLNCLLFSIVNTCAFTTCGIIIFLTVIILYRIDFMK